MKRYLTLIGSIALAAACLLTLPATTVAAEYALMNPDPAIVQIVPVYDNNYVFAGTEGQGILTPDSDFRADQLLAAACLASGKAIFLSAIPDPDPPSGDPEPEPDPGPGPDDPGTESSDAFYCN